MRISDWSSDVCSSDLLRLLEPSSGSMRFDGVDLAALPAAEMRRMRRRIQMVFQDPYSSLHPRMRVRDILAEQIGRASCRERVCQYVYISGVAVLLQKTQSTHTEIVELANTHII